MDASIDERAQVAFTRGWTCSPARVAQELVYFGSEVRDASTVKRVQQFIDHGFAVTVFGFHRTRYNNDYQPPWPHVTLGTTIDGRYAHRLLALLAAIPKLFAHRRCFTTADVFYARNIDFARLNPEDKIAFSMFLDNQVYEMYIRYIGKETIKTQYGKFNTIKFKPLLIKGSIFEGGEKMTVWVTDDANHIPVRIESPIVVGKVKIDMMGYENLRHPLTALIRRRG